MLNVRKEPTLTRLFGPLSLFFIVLILVLGALAPYLPLPAPDAIHLSAKLQAPSWIHPLGTDELGRDTLSRLIWGIRTSVYLSLIATFGTLIIGTFVGALAGLYARTLDTLFMRFIDAWLAIPAEVWTLAFVAILGPSVQNMLLAIFLAKWPWYARMVRQQVVRLTSATYIQYAHLIGRNRWAIFFTHMGPTLGRQLCTWAPMDLGGILLMISALSFLGLGVSPPTPEWGAMLSQAKNVMLWMPLQMVFPGLAITLTVLACYEASDYLRASLQEAGQHHAPLNHDRGAS